MTLTVRVADLDDVEAVRAVGCATWPPTYGPLHGDEYVERGLARWRSPEAVARGITQAPMRTYVATTGETVIGCAVVGESDGVPMLWKLYVRPDVQRSGAGKALLDAVIDGLPAASSRIQLDHAVGNDRAHAFYLSQGFRGVGAHGTGEDAQMRMERPLP